MYAEKYAADQDAFFKDYAESHAKLSNLGAKFNPPEVSRCFISVVSIAPKPLSSFFSHQNHNDVESFYRYT